MKIPRLLGSLALFLITQNFSRAATSDWLAAPQPPYPLTSALKRSSGVVGLHLILRSNGRVKEAQVTRSSGSERLDNAARVATLEWKLDPAKIRQTDLTTGRSVIVEFRSHETDINVARAVLLNASQKGSAWKSGGGGITYPFEARRQKFEGALLLEFTIGPDCHPRAVQVLKSSGVKMLDYAAVAGIQNWTAYPQFVGETCTVPIQFVMSRR